MKKLLIVFVITLIAGIDQVSAQDSKRIGGQLIYGTNINSLGVGAIAEFPIAEKMIISPSFSFYFPKDETIVKTSAFEINGNLNYMLLQEGAIHLYGLGGLNYTQMKVKTDLSIIGGTSDFSVSEGRIGLNLGAGVNFDLGKNLLPFAEIKYVLSDFDRLVLAGGIKFNF
ncbi:outer membrane protein X [Algoriphagus sp. 4150]|uniref:outer membrane protein n=1 Tax=Algoriphagus sp. 4150 TaxID=2817756 RepID=UPI002866AA7B|nr:outer membrane beta-barrel protein [Algoriphagus sp. 4150]MDR7128964.1 outer membrane protein X [Algoriphagus sp. 4150]